MSDLWQVVLVAIIAAAPGIWAAWTQLKISREGRQAADEDEKESPDLVAKWQAIAERERKFGDELREREERCNIDRERILLRLGLWRAYARKCEATLVLHNIPVPRGKPSDEVEE